MLLTAIMEPAVIISAPVKGSGEGRGALDMREVNKKKEMKP